MQAVCPSCNTLNPIGNEFCGSCGASLETAKVVTAVSQAKAKAATTSQEFTYYSSDNVLVTSTRAVVGAATYALANITSVSMRVIAPSRLRPFLGLVFGLLLFSWSLWRLVVGVGAAAEEMILSMVIGLAFSGECARRVVRARPTYVIEIASASGEAKALKSKDRDHIERIVGAMQQAISERG